MSDPRDHASWPGYGCDPKPPPSHCGLCITIGVCVALGFGALIKLLMGVL